MKLYWVLAQNNFIRDNQQYSCTSQVRIQRHEERTLLIFYIHGKGHNDLTTLLQ